MYTYNFMRDLTLPPALIPLTNLAAGGLGLYPDRKNLPPQWYWDLGLKLAGEIDRLDVNGEPNPKGRIGFMPGGMSNQKQEMKEVLAQIRQGGVMNKGVGFILAAQGGYDAMRLADPHTDYWDNIDAMLVQKKLTRKQVQVFYLKEAVAGETDPYPNDVEELAGYYATIFAIVKDLYPNLKLYLQTSRIYGGYAKKATSPEPWAFRGGLATKLFIERIINEGPQEGALPFWGPYMWNDSSFWKPHHFEMDGTHPSLLGEEEVAKMFFAFMNTSPLTKWFLPPSVLKAQERLNG